MIYRPEIDGLRALAVLPVILFHAGVELFSGGFVGVDIFFVISGYLITSIILQEKKSGKFTLVNFYERRARRILPALILVMLFSALLGIALLDSSEVIDLGESLIAVSLFLSNFLFWRESGYFDTAAESKPLLHTWSLAVEEQYYVLFPLFITIFWRFGQNLILYLLVFIFLISFYLSIWGSINKPSAAFYLLPFRGWELLIGVFLAFYLNKRRSYKTNLWINFLGIAGLALIFYSILRYDEYTPFPGLAALAPVLGTALLILYAIKGTLIYKLFTFKPLVSLGLISYSAYLWHQPIFVFSRSLFLEELNISLVLLLITLSLVLAYLSWRFVEAPFRDRTKFSTVKIWKLSLLSFCAFILIGYTLIYTAKKDSSAELIFGEKTLQLPKKYAGLEFQGKRCLSIYNDIDNPCEIKFSNEGTDFILIGDSHARVFSESIVERDEGTLVDLTLGGCPFLPNLNVFILKSEHVCNESYQEKRKLYVANNGNEKVAILSSRLPFYLYGKGFDNNIGGIEKRSPMFSAKNYQDNLVKREEDFYKSLSESINFLSAHTEKLFIILPTHTNGWDPNKRIRKMSRLGYSFDSIKQKTQIPLSSVTQRTKEIDIFIKTKAAKFNNVFVIDPKEIFCDEACNYLSKTDTPLFTDTDHLSLEANKLILAEIEDLL